MNNAGQYHPLETAKLAAEWGIKIYTIGIGDPSAKIFEIDEPMMKQISKDTNGKYFLAIDEKQLEDVYKTLDELEPIEYDEETYRPATPLYFYPLGALIMVGLLNQLIFGLINLFRKQSV